MAPLALVLVFISLWSISAVGAYLAVVGADNLQRHFRLQRGRPAEARTVARWLAFEAVDLGVLALGFLMIGSGVLFLYMVVYG